MNESMSKRWFPYGELWLHTWSLISILFWHLILSFPSLMIIEWLTISATTKSGYRWFGYRSSDHQALIKSDFQSTPSPLLQTSYLCLRNTYAILYVIVNITLTWKGALSTCSTPSWHDHERQTANEQLRALAMINAGRKWLYYSIASSTQTSSPTFIHFFKFSSLCRLPQSSIQPFYPFLAITKN